MYDKIDRSWTPIIFIYLLPLVAIMLGSCLLGVAIGMAIPR